MNEMIETDRLVLRPHTLDDFEAFHAMSIDPKVMQYISLGKPATREDSWNKMLRNGGHWHFLGYGQLAILDRQSGLYLGHTGLADFHRGLGDDFDPFPETAWAVTGAAHGKGYATEAARAAHDWFDGTRGRQRTVCIVDADNTPSIGVAGKLGYRPYAEAVYKEKRVIKFERLP